MSTPPKDSYKEKRLTANKVKIGKKYYFADTHFTYPKLFETSITYAKVYQIISGDFSTKNDGDRYEVIRVFGFATKKEAKEYLIKEIKDRKRQINREADIFIKALQQSK